MNNEQFRHVVYGDYNLQQISDEVGRFSRAFDQVPFANGRLVNGIEFTDGAIVRVEHKLGKTPEGMFITDMFGGSFVPYISDKDDKYIWIGALEGGSGYAPEHGSWNFTALAGEGLQSKAADRADFEFGMPLSETSFSLVSCYNLVSNQHEPLVYKWWNAGPWGYRLAENAGTINFYCNNRFASTGTAAPLGEKVLGAGTFTYTNPNGNLAVYRISSTLGIESAVNNNRAPPTPIAVDCYLNKRWEDAACLDGDCYWTAIYTSALNVSQLTKLYNGTAHPMDYGPMDYINYCKPVTATYTPEGGTHKHIYDVVNNPTRNASCLPGGGVGTMSVFVY